MIDSSATPSPGTLARWVCIAEATAPKAGNVHPNARFADMTYQSFLDSALAIEPELDQAAKLGVGQTVFNCVGATRAKVGSNTNLGIVLLLTPMCATLAHEPWEQGVRRVLANMIHRDASLVYEAIRMAEPGGLGRVDEGDVHLPPAMSLLEAMQLAADRDAVARQYVSDFQQVIHQVAPSLANHRRQGLSLLDAIVKTHLELIASGDTLIQRKCGSAMMRQAGDMAQSTLAAGWPATPTSRQRWDMLDTWLRADGNRRNPGASADLVTAGLFAAVRLNQLRPEPIPLPADYS